MMATCIYVLYRKNDILLCHRLYKKTINGIFSLHFVLIPITIIARYTVKPMKARLHITGHIMILTRFLGSVCLLNDFLKLLGMVGRYNLNTIDPSIICYMNRLCHGAR